MEMNENARKYMEIHEIAQKYAKNTKKCMEMNGKFTEINGMVGQYIEIIGKYMEMNGNT